VYALFLCAVFYYCELIQRYLVVSCWAKFAHAVGIAGGSGCQNYNFSMPVINIAIEPYLFVFCRLGWRCCTGKLIANMLLGWKQGVEKPCHLVVSI